MRVLVQRVMYFRVGSSKYSVRRLASSEGLSAARRAMPTKGVTGLVSPFVRLKSSKNFCPVKALITMATQAKAVARRTPVAVEVIQRRIYLVRGQKVMTDADLAKLYQVETKDLNRAVQRNVLR